MARAHGDGQVVQRGARTETLGQPVQFDHAGVGLPGWYMGLSLCTAEAAETAAYVTPFAAGWRR